MIPNKKPILKIKKSLSQTNIVGKKKSIKTTKKDKIDKEDEHQKYKGTKILPIHQSSTDTFKTFHYHGDQSTRIKSNKKSNPYYQLFEKCQRHTISAENEIIKQKQRLKCLDKRVLKQKKQDKIRNISISPIKQVQKDISSCKKHKASKSVDNIRNSDKKLHKRLNSQSQQKIIKQKKQLLSTQQKPQRVSKNLSGKKLFNNIDTNKKIKKIKQQPQTITKKDNSKFKINPKLKLKSKSSKSIISSIDNKIPKLTNKQYLNRQTKSKSNLSRIMVSDPNCKQISKRLKTTDQLINSYSSSDDSLVTIQDFNQQKKQQRIISLISEIGEEVKDTSIQKKLHKLFKITNKYIKTNDNINTEIDPPVQMIDKQINTTLKSQFKLYQINQKQTQIPIQKQLLNKKEAQKQDSSRQLEEHTNKQPSQNYNNVFMFEQSSYTPVSTKTKIKIISDYESSQRSPQTSFQQIQKIFNQRNIISNTKYQNKLKVLYKLYQNNIYSPRTFQNQIQLLDSIQDKQYNEGIELSKKIKHLAKQIKSDKQQIEELQNIFEEERWEDADQMIKTRQQEQDLKKALESFVPAPLKKPIKSQTLVLLTSPQNKNIKINQIFEHFYKLNPHLEGDQNHKQINNREEYYQQIVYSRSNKESNQYLDLSQISTIRSYCIKIYQLICQTPFILKQFITNLLTPVQYNIRDLLFIYHLDLNTEALNNRSNMSYYYWKRSLALQQTISIDSIEQLIVNLDSNQQPPSSLNLIHQRMILDALNESISQQLARLPTLIDKSNHGYFKYLKFNKLYQDYEQGYYEAYQQVETIYFRSVQRLISWAKFYCGTLPQTFQNQNRRLRQQNEISESNQTIESRRQVRMALLLHGSLLSLDTQIQNTTLTELQMKLRITKLIQNHLLEQLAKDIKIFIKNEYKQKN